jgi:hypothetical protein
VTGPTTSLDKKKSSPFRMVLIVIGTFGIGIPVVVLGVALFSKLGQMFEGHPGGSISIFGQSDDQFAIAQVNAKIKQELKDPNSAEILKSEIVDSLDLKLEHGTYKWWIVYSTVRAKNSFGAYTVSGFCAKLATKPGDHDHIYGGGEINMVECGTEEIQGGHVDMAVQTLKAVSDWDGMKAQYGSGRTPAGTSAK